MWEVFILFLKFLRYLMVFVFWLNEVCGGFYWYVFIENVVIGRKNISFN